MVKYNLYIPTSFEVIIYKNRFCKIKNLTIILYNNIFSVTFLKENAKLVKFDLESYSLQLIKYVKDVESNYSYNYNLINKYLRTFEIYFFIKIKFKGKGFKLKFNKKLKLIKFYFGRSHMTFYKLRKIKLKKVTKYKFVIKSFNLSKLKKQASKITFVKPMNVYTLRGIRLSRQSISKRKGKKSSYI